MKQSRRAVIPEIRGPLTFESWLDEPQAAATLMLVEPGAATSAEPLSILRKQKIPSDAAIVVGPEGGWTDAELAAAGQRGVRASRWAIARCAPTRCQSPRSASCSSCGGICEKRIG